ncbi:serine carboxypeptidase-like 25 [Selaginella moellendorffii]|uniref:serine carboxypeptidase-like 25 n=1 Tax=Selaginella moellendorffii TaxID=88036 RepID=UPI000D1CA911|nr:serine carboxypeptidase-like 25 [Selaginella moellendorffii]|eukprot:XP_024516757.1 serine carboxypeptidase-like 25 [Selaginella moellendorffii]
MVMPTGLTWILLILLAITASQAANPSHLVRNLPGQPQVQFKQYAGHLVVNASAQRAYFYWFFEADHQNQTSQPLALWLSGGPGCSSVGAGAFGEIGPFSVDISGTKLEKRRDAWNKASDNLQFLLEWFRNFPEYSKNEFYLLGESYSGKLCYRVTVIFDFKQYAGHYIPTLAMKILENNANGKNIINLKGFSLGNAWTDPAHDMRGDVEFYYSHSLIPEQTYNELIQNCDFSTMRPILGGSMNPNCQAASAITNRLISGLSHYNIYKPPCKNGSSITREGIRVLPGIRYNCVHATALQILDPEKTSNLDIQVAGWSQAYNGLTFLTVLGAGHMVPQDKPQQALSLFEHFLKGKVPPAN